MTAAVLNILPVDLHVLAGDLSLITLVNKI